MRTRVAVIGALLALTVAGTAVAWRAWQGDDRSRSPYAGQQLSEIRGLNAQEIDDLRNGRGAGYARTAELNSYPGPRHVLDLGHELNLSAEQARQVELVFRQMEADAQRLGHEILRREAQLSNAFGGRSISEADLQAQVSGLASLYGELRAVHLRAHLAITPLLSDEQIARYNALRGYAGTPGQPGYAAPHDHRHSSP